MRTRVMILTALAVLCMPAGAHAAEQSGPDCTNAVAQERSYEDARGDSGPAPDLGLLWVDVEADCSVTITYGLDSNGLLDGDSLWLAIDARTTRLLTVNGPVDDLRASFDNDAPAPDAYPSGASLIVVETTVTALGLQPGRPARLTFGSRYGSQTDQAGAFDLKVDFGAVAGAEAERPRIRGRAKPGRVVTCVASSGSSYRWLRDGREIRGATRRTLKLRRADAGRRIACRVGTSTSAAVRVQRR